MPTEPVAREEAPPAAVTQKPKETSPPARRSERPPAASSSGDWVVQVSATKSSREADRLRSRLEKAGWTVRVRRENGYSKVQVGPFDTKTAATAAERRLKKEESLSTWVKRS